MALALAALVEIVWSIVVWTRRLVVLRIKRASLAGVITRSQVDIGVVVWMVEHRLMSDMDIISMKSSRRRGRKIGMMRARWR